MTLTLMPYVNFTAWDNNGVIQPGALLFCYAPGTTTKQDTYTTAAGTVANANPVVCDAAGRAVVFLSPLAYKFVLAPANDVDPPSNPYWTRDNIGAIGFLTTDLDITGTAGEALSVNDAVYLADGTGGTTAGRWYKTDSDAAATSTVPFAIGFATAAIASGDTGTIRTGGRMTGMTGLSAGSTYYVAATAGAITSSAPANARQVGVADSTTTLVLNAFIPPLATTTLSGLMGISTQSFAGNKTWTGTMLFSGIATFTPAAVFTAGFSSGVQPTTTAGTGSGTATIGGVISANITPVGNVGAGTDDLMSFSVPANTLSANGKMLRVTCIGLADTDATVKNIRIVFGGTTIGPLTIDDAAQSGGRWQIVLTVVRVSATTQVMHATLNSHTGSGVDLVLYGGASPTETLANAITVKVQGVGVNNDDVIQTAMVVELVG